MHSGSLLTAALYNIIYQLFVMNNPNPSRKLRNFFRELKEQHDFICDECDRDFSENPRLLHIHHIDGNPFNQNIENLQVLCCGCHLAPKHLKGRHPKFSVDHFMKLRGKRGSFHTAESKAKISKAVRRAHAIKKALKEFDL